VAQKLPFNGSSDIGGYGPGGTGFTPQLAGALDYVDAAVGRFVAELAHRHLLGSTEIILTAKHGQSPIDPTQHLRVDPATLPGVLGGGIDIAQYTKDDVALLWLADQSQAAAAAAALRADRNGADTGHIDRVIAGQQLTRLFGDPLTDPRVPDVFIQPQHGVVYSLSKSKVAEHGGGTADDRRVALLVVAPGGEDRGRSVGTPVSTTSVAPTILAFLGLRSRALDAVRAEGTRTLPAGQ
jgi:arylsulfatase A-like enzyme